MLTTNTSSVHAILFENETSILFQRLNGLSQIGSTSLLSTSPLFEEPPVEDWCFDLIVFYRSIAEDDSQAYNVLKQLETYSKFSFAINGIVTCLLASFGLIGNFLFVLQLYKSRYFSKRLASHLAMLCAWDMALLLCCLLTYGIMASYYGILPFVGIVAYLLYFFQPFASFCVTGTIWQVLAITVERYTAVSRPLEQRTRNAQFSLRTICCCIAIGAFLLNMVVVPFERHLIDCYEFTQSGYRIRKMIVQQDLVNNQYYAILMHLVPDIIFRAPTPIIVIAILTVRTLQICAQRTVGTQTIQQARRNFLNIKFIMCNTLYMFNTILMEVMGYGGKTSNQQTELEMEQYVKSLYLTDFSNMLLAVHSATNWLIFYHWPKLTMQKQRNKLSLITLTPNVAIKSPSVLRKSSTNFCIDSEILQRLVLQFSTHKYLIANKILTVLCLNSQQISKILINKKELFYNIQSNKNFINSFENESFKGISCPDFSSMTGSSCCKQIFLESITKDIKIQKLSIELGDLMENVLHGLANKGSIFEWRDMCRQIGYSNYKINLHFSANEWKLVRNILVESIESFTNNYTDQTLSNCNNKYSEADNEQGIYDYEKKFTHCHSLIFDNEKIQERQFDLTNIQLAMIKVFNFALREMKIGALCAIVDASRQTQQSA